MRFCGLEVLLRQLANNQALIKKLLVSNGKEGIVLRVFKKR
jgi:hypothetical protein